MPVRVPDRVYREPDRVYRVPDLVYRVPDRVLRTTYYVLSSTVYWDQGRCTALYTVDHRVLQDPHIPPHRPLTRSLS